MTAVTPEDYETVLARGSLHEADPARGIGRELSFRDGPARQIVVHFGADDSTQYVREVTDRILALEEAWLLVPRHGSVGSLGLLDGHTDAAAIRFPLGARARLAHYLCTRPVGLDAVSADLYAVSESAAILLTWDHHTADEGLSIQFRHVPDATKLLVTLNELGTELELYYLDRARFSS
jgi:hypothetical protein